MEDRTPWRVLSVASFYSSCDEKEDAYIFIHIGFPPFPLDFICLALQGKTCFCNVLPEKVQLARYEIRIVWIARISANVDHIETLIDRIAYRGQLTQHQLRGTRDSGKT